MTETPTPYDRDGETIYRTAAPENQSTDEKEWPDHTDPEWLHFAYHIMGMSQREMADEVGRGETTIRYHMEKHDIPTRDRDEATSKAKGGHEKLFDEEWLTTQYEDGKTLEEIGEMLDVCGRTVRRALVERFGIEIRSRSEAQKLAYERRYGDKKYNDEEWLRHQYKHKSAAEIAEENGWAARTVRSSLRRHGIQTRSNKASNLLHTKKEKCDTHTEERELVSADGIDASWQDLKDVDRSCYIPYRDPAWLREQVEAGLTDEEIADTCAVDVSRSAIHQWRQRFGISRTGTVDGDSE